MTGFVYAIECGHAVKIGFAADPKRRFIAIKTATPHECRLLGVVPGTRADESAAHQKFRHARIRGEWFEKDQLVDFIDALQPPGSSGLKSIGFSISRATKLRIRRVQAETGMSSLSKTIVFILDAALAMREAKRAKAEPEREK